MAQALIRIHVRRKQRGEIRHGRLLTTDKMTERRARLTGFVAEDIPPRIDLDDALVNMHRTAWRVRQWLGHANHDQAVLECDFLEHMLEQQCLVGQQQGIAVQQVDFELTDAHLVHEGVARQA
ncbi:hypothetical protein D3C76_607660 [compost metagenome]